MLALDNTPLADGSNGSNSHGSSQRIKCTTHACVRFVERYLDAALVADLRARLGEDWRVLRILEKRYGVELATFRNSVCAAVGKIKVRAGYDRMPVRFTLNSGTARVRIVENVAVTALPAHERDGRARRRRPRLDAEARERLRAERDGRVARTGL